MRLDPRLFLPYPESLLPVLVFSPPLPSCAWLYRPAVGQEGEIRHRALMGLVNETLESMEQTYRLMLQLLLMRAICKECAGNGMVGGKVEVVEGKNGLKTPKQMPMRRCPACLGTGERSHLTEGVSDAGSILLGN